MTSNEREKMKIWEQKSKRKEKQREGEEEWRLGMERGVEWKLEEFGVAFLWRDG